MGTNNKCIHSEIMIVAIVDLILLEIIICEEIVARKKLMSSKSTIYIF